MREHRLLARHQVCALRRDLEHGTIVAVRVGVETEVALRRASLGDHQRHVREDVHERAPHPRLTRVDRRDRAVLADHPGAMTDLVADRQQRGVGDGAQIEPLRRHLGAACDRGEIARDAGDARHRARSFDERGGDVLHRGPLVRRELGDALERVGDVRSDHREGIVDLVSHAPGDHHEPEIARACCPVAVLTHRAPLLHYGTHAAPPPSRGYAMLR